ncbi:MAG: putative metal-binding motif-containing protein [Deltaproteobacteria bacterium]|nr:putative metal-binding motif-containing protein [Deltaproteobacteria bacterium]
MTADAAGVVHAAFRTVSGEVRHAFLDAPGWRSFSVETGVSAVDRIAVAADSTGRPRLLLYDVYAKDPVLLTPEECVDYDGDDHLPTACGGDDCHDFRADVFDGATEYCDGLDNNCDSDIDEDCVPLTDDDADDDADDDDLDDDDTDDMTDDDDTGDGGSLTDDDLDDDDTDIADVPGSSGGAVTNTGAGGCGCGC